MKKAKVLLSLLLAVIIVAASAGCANQATAPASSAASPSQASSAPTVSSEAPVNSEAAASAQSETVKFTDSIGREVEIPSNLERIAPSGPLAQVVLYTLCPDKLAGLGSKLGESAYIASKYKDLPLFGNFYADTLNLEAVMAAKPQIVIDIGEAKASVADDMKGVQDKTGIPSVFIHMELDDMAEAYRTLGKLVGEEEQAEKLAAYVEETLADAKKFAAAVPEADRVKLYYGQGDAGLTAVVKGTVHSDVIDIIGALNVADVSESVRGGASDISMEQLMLWQPDAILFAPDSIYQDVLTRSEWQQVNAVKNKKIYEIPSDPYNWLGRPPSVNRILGVRWLGNLLYPDTFKYDMVKETQNFYKLFYHTELTEEQAKELLSTSTYQA